MHCPLCGGKLSTKWHYKKVKDNAHKVTYPSYRCINGLKGVCTAKTMSHAKVEIAFEEYLSHFEEFTELECASQSNAIHVHDNGAEIATIANELKQIEKKTEEIMTLFVSNSIGFTTYQGMVKVSNERRSVLEARLGILTSENENLEVRYSKAEIVANFRDNWKTLDNEQRLQFVQKFIKKITIHSEAQRNNIIHGNVVIGEVIFNEF